MKLYRRLGLLPLAWLCCFALLPYLVLAKVSLAQVDDIGMPPFTPLVQDGAWLANLDNYRLVTDDALYLDAYAASLRIAAIATLLCLAIGYPLAYGIARAPERWRLPLLMAVVLPFWTSFLIRVYAWIGLLAPTGTLNQLLLALGAIDTPLQLLNTDFAVMLGIAYAYLPFMVLPIYAVLARLDVTLLEAASDLGAGQLARFTAVTLPLSLPGIVAGALLVFIPAVGEFVIPDLLGGPDTLMIGKVLWNEFFMNGDWPVASAVALLMMLVLVLPLLLLDHHLARVTARRGA